MEFERLGTTDIQVSRITLGTWAIGGWMWGGTDVQDAVRAIHEALDMGITTIDTAPVYGFGLAEEIVAQALSQKGVRRDQVVIATKAGLNWNADEDVWRDSRPQRVMEEVDASLRRLRTDYIDLYQIHWPDPDIPVEQTAHVLDELYRSGKIRAVGVSNYTVEQMDRWRSAAPLHSNQPRYSLIDRGIEADVLPYCREHDIAVLAYSPFARGLLTGKYTKDAGFPPGDSRARDKRFQGEAFQRNLRIVARLQDLAAELGKTVAQLAVRWVLDQQGITSALWGARYPGQIGEAAGALGWRLSAEEEARIRLIVADESHDHDSL